jgi:LacI family transcriptional regulator
MSEVTIYDIAKALELSPSTISRALSGGTLVRKDTLTKVLEKARDLGYRHNFFASNLRSNRTHFIGAIVPRLNTLFVSNILSGAEIVTSRLNYSLFVSQSMDNPDQHMANIQ